MICLLNTSPHWHNNQNRVLTLTFETKDAHLLIQIFDGDIFQIFDAFLADGLDLEIWQVDDQSLLDFFNARFHQVVSFLFIHI